MGSNEVSSTEYGRKKVCIVGGGPAGLVSLRRVLDSPILTGTIFEQKSDIGGMWHYNGKKTFPTSSKNLGGSNNRQNGNNEEGLVNDPDPENVTTMYDNLSCNLPYVLMEFKDFNHKKDQNTFATQEEMHEYLKGYATHFNLWPHIQVNTAVVDIRPEDPNAKEGEPGRWIVETHNHVKDVYNKEIFDAVIICIGKNAYPHKPLIPGLENFQGKVMHSKYFKHGQELEGKNVVCIGLGPTSGDIGVILSKWAKQVTVCHKFPFGFNLGLLPSNVREVKNVKLVTKDGVVTEDNETVTCDVIVLCTGYGLQFRFLNDECSLEVINDKYIPHLYNMTIFTKRPTLSILNMCYRSPEYIIMEIQARYIVSYLEGKTKLSFEEMEAAVKEEEAKKKKQGIPYSLWFQIGDFGLGCWQYFLKMAKEIGIQEDYKHVSLIENVYNIVVPRIFGKQALFRNDKLIKVNDTNWEMLLSSSPEFPESKPGKVSIMLNADGSATVDTTEIDAA